MTSIDTTTAPVAATETITLRMSRKQFNGFLRSLYDMPDDESWKTADLVIDRDTIGEDGDFYLIEVFTRTPVSPMIALHDNDNLNAVTVTCRPPDSGIHPTAKAMIEASRIGEAA